MNKKIKLVNSIILSSILVSVFIPAVTIAAEVFPPLKDWLKNTFSHHWIGKSVVSTVLFLALSALAFVAPIKTSLDGTRRLLGVLTVLIILGSLVILGFFYWEVFLR